MGSIPHGCNKKSRRSFGFRPETSCLGHLQDKNGESFSGFGFNWASCDFSFVLNVVRRRREGNADVLLLFGA